MLLAHVICLVLILLDQSIKWLVAASPYSALIKSFKIPGLLSIVTSWNTGISFGCFGNICFANNLILVINTLIIGFMYRATIKSYNSVTMCYFVVLAGAISNCIDRVLNDAVLDFISVYIINRGAIVLNIADVYIAFGIFWCIINKIKGK